jgi:hypothetical protein
LENEQKLTWGGQASAEVLADHLYGSSETAFVNRLGATLTMLLSVTAKIRFWVGG